jgi:hypothetical protein
MPRAVAKKIDRVGLGDHAGFRPVFSVRSGTPRDCVDLATGVQPTLHGDESALAPVEYIGPPTRGPRRGTAGLVS